MKFRVEAISRCGESRYRVLLATDAAPLAHREFIFTVEGDDIRVVAWRNDFSEFVGHGLGPAKALLEAVLSFDFATNMELQAG